jgi:soluble lytic murein transglycosylase
LASEPDASAGKPPATLSLDAVRPISARPVFTSLSQAVEQGNDRRALQSVRDQLRAVDAPAPELQRLHLWLGYAYRKRDNVVQALFHFEEASRVDWPLVGYAQWRSAECLVALGRAEEGLRRLTELKANGPLGAAADLLRAQVYAQTGRVAQAIPLWRTYVARTPVGDPERSRVGLMLAEAIVGLSGAQGSASATAFREGETSASVDTLQQEAFALLDPLQNRTLDADAQERALDLRSRLISIVFAGRPGQQQQCKLTDRINEAEALVEQRELNRALAAVESVLAQFQPEERFSLPACRALFLMAQSRLLKGESTAAAAAFDNVADHCVAPDDLVARALFQSGRRQLDTHDAPRAIARFEELQRRFPQHRLADDARLKSANAYLELGSESKFVDLVLHMADDYPEGDQVPEGLFLLALHRMIKSDWSGAASVLATLGQLPRITNHDDPEQTERQQYFAARAQLEQGQTEQALSAFERLVRERPFSYYMLLANSRLSELDAARAQRALGAGDSGPGNSPFEIPFRAELSEPGFTRAMELMALGEMEAAGAELHAMKLPKELELQLLWARASFEAAAGDLKGSQRIVRERLRGWPRLWPTGAWEGAWKLAYPQPFYEIVRRESARTAVPIALVYAVMREESLFDQDAVSFADAHGLMQLIVPTAQRAARQLGMSVNARALKRPEINIALGCQVLKSLLDRFSNKQALAIAGYNAGPGRPARWMKERPDLDLDVWVETIPFSETRTYVKHVLASSAVYAWLYDHERTASPPQLPRRLGD